MAVDRKRKILLLMLMFHRHKKRLNLNFDKGKRKHRMWVRQIFRDRRAKGEYSLLIKDMALFDHKYFLKQFRMLPAKLEELLSFVGPLITKSSIRRETVSPRERLCVTLRYLFVNVSVSTQ